MPDPERRAEDGARETAEALAEVLYHADVVPLRPLDFRKSVQWADCPESSREEYRHLARAAIGALARQADGETDKSEAALLERIDRMTEEAGPGTDLRPHEQRMLLHMIWNGRALFAAQAARHREAEQSLRLAHEINVRCQSELDRITCERNRSEAEVARLRARLAEVEMDRDGLLAFKRGVDEALNSGDGSYRP